MSDLYSEAAKKDNKIASNIKRNFYNPMNDRRVVIVNNSEEIKIINKLMNMGRRAIENNEYYNDLMSYRLYPYVNFKDFKQNGFPLQLTKTVDVVRHVSVEQLDVNRQSRDEMNQKDSKTGYHNAEIK